MARLNIITKVTGDPNNPLPNTTLSADEVNTITPAVNALYDGLDTANTNITALQSAITSAVSGFKGSLAIANTPSAGVAGYYFPSENGTYTNAGGLVVNLTDGLNVITQTAANVFTKIIVPLNLSNYALKTDALTTDANGNLFGAVVPAIQYKHVRGDAEIAGNNTFTNASIYGIAMWEAMVNNVLFNQVTVPLWAGSDTAVTFRIYKSTGTTPTPATQTLLEEVVVPAGSFNTVPSTNYLIQLTNSYKALATERIYVYAYTTAGTKLSYRYWSALAGASPERHNFIVTGQTTIDWSVAWTTQGSTLYQSTFVLSEKTATQIALEAAITSLQKNAVVADATNNITGVKIPLTQIQHPRGISEELGNTTYPAVSTNYGICFYEKMANAAVFNSTIAAIFANVATAITVRWYKSSAFTNLIANQTLLSEVQYAAGTWNSTTGTEFEFKSPVTMSALKDEYVYMYVYWTAGITAKLSAQYWNALFGSAPERHTFLTLGAATAWATNWTIGGAGFYQPALRFLYRNDVELDLTSRVVALELNKAFDPQLAIPANINLAVGRELNVWNDALIKDWGKDKDVSYISSVTNDAVIRPKERGLRYTGATIESKVITTIVRNSNGSVLGTQAFNLNVVSKTKGTGTINIMFVGDSTIQGVESTINGPIPTEVRNLFVTDGGATPYLLGTQGTAPNRHEGRGGWTWSNFLAVSNITNGPNAFWDATNSRNDFQKYMTTNSNFGAATSLIDVVVIQLGINDIILNLSGGITAVDTAIANAKTFINGLLNATTGFPNCKVIISMPLISSITKDAWAIDFPNLDRELYEQYMRNYHKKLISNFDNGIFNANVSVCASYLFVDRFNGYNKVATAISARFTTTEMQFKSQASVHPGDSGYYQAADCIYSQIRSVLP